MKSALARQSSISRLQGPRMLNNEDESPRKRIPKSVTFDKTDEIIQYIAPTPEITEENWDQFSLESCDSDHDLRPLPVLPSFMKGGMGSGRSARLGSEGSSPKSGRPMRPNTQSNNLPAPSMDPRAQQLMQMPRNRATLDEPLGQNDEDFDFALRDAANANYNAMDSIAISEPGEGNTSTNSNISGANNSGMSSTLGNSSTIAETKKVANSISPASPTPELGTAYTGQLLPSPIEVEHEPIIDRPSLDERMNAIMGGPDSTVVRSGMSPNLSDSHQSSLSGGNPKHKRTDSEMSNFSDYGEESHFPIHKQVAPPSPTNSDDGTSTWRDEREAALARQDSLQDSQRNPETQQISETKLPPPDESNAQLGRTYSKRRTKLLQMLDPQGAGTVASSVSVQGFGAITEEDEEESSKLEDGVSSQPNDSVQIKELSEDSQQDDANHGSSRILKKKSSVISNNTQADETIGISKEPAALFAADNMTFNSVVDDKSAIDNSMRNALSSQDLKAVQQSSPKLEPSTPTAGVSQEPHNLSIPESFDFSLPAPQGTSGQQSFAQEIGHEHDRIIESPIKMQEFSDVRSELIDEDSEAEENSQSLDSPRVDTSEESIDPSIRQDNEEASKDGEDESKYEISRISYWDTNALDDSKVSENIDNDDPSMDGASNSMLSQGTSSPKPKMAKSFESLNFENPPPSPIRSLQASPVREDYLSRLPPQVRESKYSDIMTPPRPVKRWHAFPGVLPWDPSYDTTMDNLAMMAVPPIPQKSPKRNRRSVISEYHSIHEDSFSEEKAPDTDKGNNTEVMEQVVSSNSDDKGPAPQGPSSHDSNDEWIDESDSGEDSLEKSHALPNSQSAISEKSTRENHDTEGGDTQSTDVVDSSILEYINGLQPEEKLQQESEVPDNIDRGEELAGDHSLASLREQPSFVPMVLPHLSPISTSPFLGGDSLINSPPIDNSIDSQIAKGNDMLDSSTSGQDNSFASPQPVLTVPKGHTSNQPSLSPSMADNETSILQEMSFTSGELAEFQSSQKQGERYDSHVRHPSYHDYQQEEENPELDSELSEESIISEDDSDSLVSGRMSNPSLSQIDTLGQVAGHEVPNQYQEPESSFIYPTLDPGEPLSDYKRSSAISMVTAQTTLDEDVSIREPSFGENMASTMQSMFPEPVESQPNVSPERANYTVRESSSYVIATSPQKRTQRSSAYEVLDEDDSERTDVPYQHEIPRRPMPVYPASNIAANSQEVPVSNSNWSVGVSSTSSPQRRGVPSSSIASSLPSNYTSSNTLTQTHRLASEGQSAGSIPYRASSSEASIPSTISKTPSSTYSLARGSSTGSAAPTWWAKPNSKRLEAIAEPSDTSATMSSKYSESSVPDTAATQHTSRDVSQTTRAPPTQPQPVHRLHHMPSTLEPLKNRESLASDNSPTDEFESSIYSQPSGKYSPQMEQVRSPQSHPAEKIAGLLYLQVEGISCRNIPDCMATLIIDNGVHCISTPPVPMNALAGLNKEYRIGLIANQPARVILRLSSNDNDTKALKNIEVGTDGSLASFDVAPLREKSFGRSTTVDLRGEAKWSDNPHSTVATLHAVALYIPCVSAREHAPGTLNSAMDKINKAKRDIQGIKPRMSGELRQYGGDIHLRSGKRRFVVLDPISPLLVINSSQTRKARTLVNLAKATGVKKLGSDCMELQFKNKDALAFKTVGTGSWEIEKWIHNLQSVIGNTTNVRPKWVDAVLYERHT